MDTAKLFPNGRSQEVRLPKEYAFSGEEVHIKKLGNSVPLIPTDDPFETFLSSFDGFTDDVFAEDRNQPPIESRDPVG